MDILFLSIELLFSGGSRLFSSIELLFSLKIIARLLRLAVHVCQIFPKAFKNLILRVNLYADITCLNVTGCLRFTARTE